MSVKLTCGQRDLIRSSWAWCSAHLLRADRAPNIAITDKHDELSLKYLREVASVYGFDLVEKKSV